MTLTSIQKKLRAYNRKNYYLFFFCNTIALMLITAYTSLMFSPTVLLVLPPGGDSRKQMTAIFVLTCVGCVVFILYAANLFFRIKSKEIGIFMALGASPAFIKKELRTQSASVFTAPTIVGVGMMSLLYSMLMYANDGQYTVHEWTALGTGFGLILLVVALIYCIYRLALRKMQILLDYPLIFFIKYREW